jgi:hypothetical protein
VVSERRFHSERDEYWLAAYECGGDLILDACTDDGPCNFKFPLGEASRFRDWLTAYLATAQPKAPGGQGQMTPAAMAAMMAKMRCGQQATTPPDVGAVDEPGTEL